MRNRSQIAILIKHLISNCNQITEKLSQKTETEVNRQRISWHINASISFIVIPFIQTPVRTMPSAGRYGDE